MKKFISFGSQFSKQRAFQCFRNTLVNQRGVALVMAMGMLTLLSIIGAMSLSTSSTEMSLSGNYKTKQLAFYAAERAVEYATVNGDIYATIGTGVTSLDEEPHLTNIVGSTNENVGLLVGGADVNQVSFQAAGNLPPGSGSDPTYFEARYYLVNVTGQGPNNSAARVEAQIGRIVPK